MPTPIVLADPGASARLSAFYVAAGERVYEGDRVAEVTIPGAAVDVPAPVTGVLRLWHVRPGDAVSAGAVLGLIDPETEG